MKEFLFLDQKRLNSYAEQIGPPVVYDKVPVWSAELSLTGVRGSTTHSRHARSATQSEKIASILPHLQENQLLIEGRPNADNHDATFAIETCLATRVLVPASNADNANELAMWISIPDTPHESGLLCLLEDFHGPDGDRPATAPSISAYTLLMSVIQALHVDNRSTVLVKPFKITDPAIGQMRLADAWRNAQDYMLDFAKNPVETLLALGCTPGPQRRIEVLYRIREFGSDCLDREDSYRERISVFGYPIYVASA